MSEPNGIAQLFQMKKKLNNIKLVNNWIKYKLDPVFENNLWQTQAEIQQWLVKYGDVTPPPPHTPNIFSSVLDDLQKWPLWGVGGLFPPSPTRGAAPGRSD